MNAQTNVRAAEACEPAIPLDAQVAQARREMGEARWAELDAEWNATVECHAGWTLDQHTSAARREMGEQRWAELMAEWDAPVANVSKPAVSQWKAGAR